MHVLPKAEASLRPGLLVTSATHAIRMRSELDTHANHMYPPLAFNNEIPELREAAAAARAADDIDFVEVKAAATALSEQIKSNATLVAQTLPALRSPARRACPIASAPGRGVDLSGIDATLGLLVHPFARRPREPHKQ